MTRREVWLKLTGLLPPEERGFTPAVEGDELPEVVMLRFKEMREAAERGNKKLDHNFDIVTKNLPKLPRQREDIPYPMKPKWALPSRSVDETPPSWDNVVRAYEEV